MAALVKSILPTRNAEPELLGFRGRIVAIYAILIFANLIVWRGVYRAFRLAERGDHVTEEEMDALLHQRGSSRCLSRAGGVVFGSTASNDTTSIPVWIAFSDAALISRFLSGFRRAAHPVKSYAGERGAVEDQARPERFRRDEAGRDFRQ